MKPTIILILALLSGAASADDIYFTLGGWSVHEKKYIDSCFKFYDEKISPYRNKIKPCKRKKYNGDHNSLIFDYKGLTIGTYKNSFYNRTNLIGYTYRKNGFSATAAYGTGYIVDDVKNSCPFKLGKECALLSVGYTYKNVKASLMGKALAVSFEFKL